MSENESDKEKIVSFENFKKAQQERLERTNLKKEKAELLADKVVAMQAALEELPALRDRWAGVDPEKAAHIVEVMDKILEMQTELGNRLSSEVPLDEEFAQKYIDYEIPKFELDE